MRVYSWLFAGLGILFSANSYAKCFIMEQRIGAGDGLCAVGVTNGIKLYLFDSKTDVVVDSAILTKLVSGKSPRLQIQYVAQNRFGKRKAFRIVETENSVTLSTLSGTFLKSARKHHAVLPKAGFIAGPRREGLGRWIDDVPARPLPTTSYSKSAIFSTTSPISSSESLTRSSYCFELSQPFADSSAICVRWSYGNGIAAATGDLAFGNFISDPRASIVNKFKTVEIIHVVESTVTSKNDEVIISGKLQFANMRNQLSTSSEFNSLSIVISGEQSQNEKATIKFGYHTLLFSSKCLSKKGTNAPALNWNEKTGSATSRVFESLLVNRWKEQAYNHGVCFNINPEFDSHVICHSISSTNRSLFLGVIEKHMEGDVLSIEQEFNMREIREIKRGSSDEVQVEAEILPINERAIGTIYGVNPTALIDSKYGPVKWSYSFKDNFHYFEIGNAAHYKARLDQSIDMPMQTSRSIVKEDRSVFENQQGPINYSVNLNRGVTTGLASKSQLSTMDAVKGIKVQFQTLDSSAFSSKQRSLLLGYLKQRHMTYEAFIQNYQSLATAFFAVTHAMSLMTLLMDRFEPVNALDLVDSINELEFDRIKVHFSRFRAWSGYFQFSEPGRIIESGYTRIGLFNFGGSRHKGYDLEGHTSNLNLPRMQFNYEQNSQECDIDLDAYPWFNPIHLSKENSDVRYWYSSYFNKFGYPGFELQ